MENNGGAKPTIHCFTELGRSNAGMENLWHTLGLGKGYKIKGKCDQNYRKFQNLLEVHKSSKWNS